MKTIITVYIIAWIVAIGSLAFGQVGPAPGVGLQDEGVSQGRVQILNCTGAGISCSKSGVTGTVNVAGGGGSAYNQIQEEGTNLTQRTILNFIGTSITCVDDGATKTNCTISGGGSGLTHQEVMSRISLGF